MAKCKDEKHKPRGYPANKSWRRRNRKIAQESKKRNYSRTRIFATNRGAIWTDEDDFLITAANRPCDRDLAKRIGRSVQAIQVHRSKMQKSQRGAVQD